MGDNTNPSGIAPVADRDTSAHDVLAGVLGSLAERFKADAAAAARGEKPEPMSDQRIAEWQIEALELAGWEVVRRG